MDPFRAHLEGRLLFLSASGRQVGVLRPPKQAVPTNYDDNNSNEGKQPDTSHHGFTPGSSSALWLRASDVTFAVA